MRVTTVRAPPVQEVAVGVCNHQAVCGRCCLRLRQCFSNNRCSLCNTELKEVRL